MAKKTNTVKKAGLYLVGIYLGLCVLRYVLSVATSFFPTSIPDEFLYFSVARSLATGNGAMLYGQQANYSYCLYPLLLSIAYLFPDGTDHYRVMQIISILVMNLTLFPAYALGKRILRDDKKSLFAAVVTVLLPDFILAERLLSESLIYPLFFLMLFLACSGSVKSLALAGAVGGLLFAVKPGHIVTPAVMILFTAVSNMKTDRRKGLAALGAGFGAMAAAAGLMLLLNMLVLNPGTTVFSMYDSQIVSEKVQYGAFVRAAVLSPYTFLLAAGVLPVLAPLCHADAYDSQQRTLLYASLVSAAVLMLGTAWVVNRVEYTDPTVHTRYIAMFFPVLFMLLLALPDRVPAGLSDRPHGRAAGIICIVLAAFAALSSLIFRFDGGMNTNANIIFNYALSWLRALSRGARGSVALSVLISLLIGGCCLICRTMKPKSLRNTAVALFLFLLFVNTVSAYSMMAENNGYRETAVNDTEAIRAAAGDETFITVIGDSRTRYDALLDVNSKDNRSIVYVNDLFNHTLSDKGVYTPFVPEIIHGDIPDRPTADTELLLFDRDAYSCVQLSPNAVPAAETLTMTLVQIKPGERWADAILGGPVGGRLPAGTKAYFVCFDDKPHFTLSVEMTLAADAEVVIDTDATECYSFHLPAGTDTYNIGISGARTVSLSSECDIEFHSFRFTD